METTISAGAVFGTIAFVVIFLILAGITALFILAHNDTEDTVFASFFGFATVISVIIYVSSMWPFSWEYHEWRPTAGTIERVDKRMVSNGEGMQERYVVRFNNGDERACDDTRCSLLDKGDWLKLKCKREFQWVGTDGWGCSYVDSKRG